MEDATRKFQRHRNARRSGDTRCCLRRSGRQRLQPHQQNRRLHPLRGSHLYHQLQQCPGADLPDRQRRAPAGTGGQLSAQIKSEPAGVFLKTVIETRTPSIRRTRETPRLQKCSPGFCSGVEINLRWTTFEWRGARTLFAPCRRDRSSGGCLCMSAKSRLNKFASPRCALII